MAGGCEGVGTGVGDPGGMTGPGGPGGPGGFLFSYASPPTRKVPHKTKMKIPRQQQMEPTQQNSQQ